EAEQVGLLLFPVWKCYTARCCGPSVLVYMSRSALSNQVSPPACLWKENPNRLVSLWDIVRYFPVHDFHLIIKNIEYLKDQCEELWLRGEGACLLSKDMRK